MGRTGAARAWTLLRLLPVLTALAMAVSPARPAAARARADDGRETVPGQLLLTLAPQSAPPSAAAWAALDLGDHTPLSRRVALVRVAAGTEAAAAQRLRRLPGVLAVEPNRVLRYTATPDDPFYARQWSHRQTGAPRAWDTTRGSAAVTIAMLDSGIDGRHPELRNVLARVDATGGRVRAGAVDNDRCRIGHGTTTAGIAGAMGNNGAGITGVNWTVGLIDVALSSPETSCKGPTDAAIVAALDYVTHRAATAVDVVNMSFGAPSASCPTSYQAVIAEARRAGIVLVSSTGNEEQRGQHAGKPQIPAACAGVIAVGATRSNGAVAAYSTTNDQVDLVAPGGSRADGEDSSALLLTTARQGSYALVEGTSFAAPYVAGLAALLRAADSSLTPDQVEAVLEATATDLGPAGRDRSSGWGLVAADAAMARVVSKTVPALRPDPPFPVGDRRGRREPGAEDRTPRFPTRAARPERGARLPIPEGSGRGP